jgi:hypothetical protein
VQAFFEQVLQAVRMVGDTSLQILGGRVHTLICGAGHFSQDAAQYLRVCKTAGANFTDSGGVELVGGWQPLILSAMAQPSQAISRVTRSLAAMCCGDCNRSTTKVERGVKRWGCWR